MSERFPQLSNVSSMYGAPMGRRSEHAGDRDLPIKFHLTRVRFVDGDYDKGGAYWGSGGGPLFQAWGENAEETVELYYRAVDREHAKQQVLTQYPKARFYR